MRNNKGGIKLELETAKPKTCDVFLEVIRETVFLKLDINCQDVQETIIKYDLAQFPQNLILTVSDKKDVRTACKISNAHRLPNNRYKAKTNTQFVTIG